MNDRGAGTMIARFVISILMRVAAGVMSFAVMAYGIYSFISVDLKRDAQLSFLFCLLPTLSFPVFLLSFRWLRASTWTHWLIAAAYLTVYSLLDWRTCAEMGYCDGMLNNVMRTLTTRPVEMCIGVAALSLVSLPLRGRPRLTKRADRDRLGQDAIRRA
jgi:hypothetical protein